MQGRPSTRQDCLHYVCTVDPPSIEPQLKLDPNVYGTKEAPLYNGPPAQTFEFQLDPFQKIAIGCVERRESVLVAAHTSAGKTVVAEYACAVGLRERQKVVYTAPIKALSNQKFREFSQKFGHHGEATVGLMTGDVTVNPNAPIVVMTTEILRNMLYRASEMLDEIAWVIFDEVHYMQDRERGVVWEETIIILPHAIRMIFLSATLPNSKEFAEWIAHVHMQPCHVVYTEFRPTPLKHYGYAQGGELMLSLIDSNGQFKPDAFDQLLMKLKESKDTNRMEEDETGRWKKADQASAPGKFDDLHKLVNLFKTSDFLPAIVFCFGKRLAEQNAYSIIEVMDLTTDEEKKSIDYIFDKAVCSLSEADQALPVIDDIRAVLRKGVGIHHSGMLPLLKELTEILFQESFVKVLCATETFAMGLNMPARTVLFTSLNKYDGVMSRIMSSGEYIQMSGRAGRRGKDKKGFVVMMLDAYTSKEDCKKVLMGQVGALQSSFRLSYYTLLNLLQKVEGTQQSIDDVIRKSFNQFQHDRSIPQLQFKLEELEKKAEALAVDKATVKRVRRGQELKEEAQKLKQALNAAKLDHSKSLLLWSPGRLIQVAQWGVGIVIAPLAPAFGDPYFLDVAFPCRQTSDQRSPYAPANIMAENCLLGIFPVFLSQIEEVYRVCVEVAMDLTLEDRKRDLLRSFKNLMQSFDAELPVLRWIEDIEVDDPTILPKIEALEQIELELLDLKPTQNDMDVDLTSQVEEKISVMVEIDETKKEMENSMLRSFQEEYKARVAVLKKLGHINADGVLTLKGKAACEIDAGDELLCAELLFDGTLKRVDRNYRVAFLSCIIPFHERTETTPSDHEALREPFERLRSFAQHIGDVSVECKVEMEVAEFVEGFHLCFVEVMHAWETGAHFIDVCRISDIYEGVIIRAARRLAELIQQLAAAARVMGDMELVEQLEESNITLKRDIMFAASLYV